MAVVSPPAEDEYLGKMPTAFKLMAVLLGDLDGGDGLGKVYFREDSSPDVLRRATEHIKEAFPQDEDVDPASALIVTWENMAARGDGLDTKVRDRVGSGSERHYFLTCTIMTE